ncbi:MAG: hypothetical protein WCL44_08545 [bacterium]
MATQTEPKSIKPQVFSPAKLVEVVSAVRAFCVIYNTSLTYDTMNQIFQKAVEERMPVFKAALSGVQELPIFFGDGQIRLGTAPLDPGSGMFQKLSNEFQSMGISGISILPSVSEDDIRNMMKTVVAFPDEIAGLGLQHFLSRDGVVGIVENKPMAQPVNGDVSESSEPRGQDGNETGAPVGRGGESTVAPNTGTAAEAHAAALRRTGHMSPSPRSMRDFITGAIGALGRSEAKVEEVADIIATEFEHRLNERIEQAGRASEKRMRRLEDMQDLILKELENHAVAAFVIDSHLRILSANALGRGIFGDTAAIDSKSPLGAFILSQCDRQEVTVSGVVRTAHLLTATPAGGDSMMLLSLE